MLRQGSVDHPGRVTKVGEPDAEIVIRLENASTS